MACPPHLRHHLSRQPSAISTNPASWGCLWDLHVQRAAPAGDIYVFAATKQCAADTPACACCRRIARSTDITCLLRPNSTRQTPMWACCRQTARSTAHYHCAARQKCAAGGVDACRACSVRGRRVDACRACSVRSNGRCKRPSAHTVAHQNSARCDASIYARLRPAITEVSPLRSGAPDRCDRGVTALEPW